MSDFLSNAACNGRRPRSLSAAKVTPRPAVVNRLMSERHVARFVVAPAGYGKSFLALEYAQTVFDFLHVFWIDAKSPCFLRDLDKGNMAEEVLLRDPQARLIVVDDVPLMGTKRCDELSRCLDAWLSQGCEVLVLCPPSCDAFGARQPDRICLTPNELLLGPEDWGQDEALLEDAEASSSFDEKRIAQLFWGGQDRYDLFAQGMAKEIPTRDLSLLFFLILLECDVTMGELLAWGSSHDREALARISTHYPHLGYLEELEVFHAVRLPVEAVAKAYRGRIAAFAEATGSEDVGELLLRLSDSLLVAGKPERACNLIRLLANAEVKKLWAFLHGQELLEQGVFCCLGQLLKPLHFGSDAKGAKNSLVQALCLAMLGQASAACSIAARLMSSSYVDVQDADTAALLLMRIGQGDLRRKASLYLSKPEGDPSFLGEMLLALGSDRKVLPQLWQKGVGEGATQHQTMLAAAWCLPFCPGEFSSSLSRYLSLIDPDSPLSTVDYLIVRECQIEEERVGSLGVVPRDLMVAFYRFETSLIHQRSEYSAFLESGSRRKEQNRRALEMSASHGVASPAVPTPDIPTLSVDLVGSLEVSVGGFPVEASLVRRRSVRALLAILVLNAGHELSRDRLVVSLWPDSSLASARKNLYTVWSELKRALSDFEGRCPYLYHARGGYKLLDDHLRSDVARINQLCNVFRFDPIDEDRWAVYLRELEKISQGDLLPGEEDNTIIASARDEYRARVVSSLVMGATRLLAEEKNGLALWFSEAAFEREKQREDVYYVLMASQLACGQRESALDTFFRDKKFLAESLGIDPSSRMVALYRRIVEEEEEF